MIDNVISLHDYLLAKQRQGVKDAVLNAMQDYKPEFSASHRIPDECDADFKLRLKNLLQIIQA